MDKNHNYRFNCRSRDDGQKANTKDRSKAEEKTADELLTEELSKGIDLEGMGIGLVIADLFKTVSLAALRLPSMELYSDMICVVVDDDSITVSITGLNPESDAGRSRKHGKVCCCGCHDDPGYEEDEYDPSTDDDDEEEGMIYDGD